MPERQLTKAETDANVKKAIAEAAQADANAKRATAEASKFLSEARIAEMLETVQRINLEKAQEERSIEKTSNYYHHLYDFNGEVMYSSVKNCMAQLRVWDRLDPTCDIEIVFNSPGGSVIDGMALFDYIQMLRRKGHKITTGALGYAASMGGILLQAGETRWIGAEAYILVHEISAAAVGKIGEMEDEMEFLRKIQSRVLDIFASRTKLTKKQIDTRWKRKDYWIDSAESLRMGFVDEVR